MNTDPSSFQTHRRAGFTVIELIAVLVVLAVLGVMLLTALAGARPNSAAFQCLNNLRQLQIGWQAYSTENNDGICPTGGTPTPAGVSNWVFGRMDLFPSQIDVTQIQQGALWPYIKLSSVYKCPADLSESASGVPRVRSISMNAWMNPYSSPAQIGLSGPGRVFRKQSDIGSAMPPSQCWVVLDENPLTINDGWFVASTFPGGPFTFSWIDPPATYHDKGCGLSLADGHAEIKRWRDRYLLSTSPTFFMAADPSVPPGYGDLRWLQDRTTVPP